MSAIKYYKLYLDERNYAEVVETFDDMYYEDYEEALELAIAHNNTYKLNGVGEGTING